MTDVYHTHQIKTITIAPASTDDTRQGSVTIVLRGYPLEKLLINGVQASRMTKDQLCSLLKIEWSKLTDPYTEESILTALREALAEKASEEVSQAIFEMFKSGQSDDASADIRVNQPDTESGAIEPERFYRVLSSIRAMCEGKANDIAFVSLPKLVLAVNHTQEGSPTYISAISSQITPSNLSPTAIPLTDMVKFLIRHNLV